MRRVWIIAIVLFLGLACACPVTGNVDNIFQDAQNTIDAAMTQFPGTAAAIMTSLPATVEAQIETPDVAQPGTIRGNLSYPSDFLPAQRIVAFDAATMAFVADVTTAQGDGAYELAVPAGDYYVIAYTIDGGLSAGYSQAVPCGLTVECSDHSLIPVHVDSGATAENIDPQDWYAPPGTFPPMP